MKNINNDYSHIKGWGVDADTKNDPTYPIQNRKNGPLKYERKDQKLQDVNQEVLYSNERPYVSAVFGLGPEPSGLNGKLRRYAFQHGENEYSHWLPLLLADRVNAIEGIVEDIKNGKLPNIIAEKGWPAQWKHDKVGLMKKLAIYAGITAGTYFLLTRNKK
ncbi:hypothetical protein [Marivirga sp.]|uniref:hypothetical protein n=1 Tax=Marivirga sp. TaxID=2018662 RepID=UPI002D80BB98|nr:hypothetical protein [Marivirga sp.]HET8860047.1 hypothetical protein [Marivirga sp.]